MIGLDGCGLIRGGEMANSGAEEGNSCCGSAWCEVAVDWSVVEKEMSVFVGGDANDRKSGGSSGSVTARSTGSKDGRHLLLLQVSRCHFKERMMETWDVTSCELGIGKRSGVSPILPSA